MRSDRETFEAHLEDALMAVPERFREQMHNVAIVLEETLDRTARGEEGYEGVEIEEGCDLLGLYEGVGWLSAVGIDNSLALPDKITVFMDVIVREAEETGDDLAMVIRHTLWHELAHYFGFDEDGARRLETKWEDRYRAIIEGKAG